MKKYHFISIILSLPIFVFSQIVEVDGKLKIPQMDTINSENLIVVKRMDGTLAARQVSSLPVSQTDTTRTLQSDLLLTLTLCNCPSLPPAMIQSLLDNGYSIQELIDFQISYDNLLLAGLTIVDLLNSGQTPIDLYKGGINVDSLYGKNYAGGLIFYLDTLDEFPLFEGLVAAPIDQDSGPWGCWSFSTGGTSSSIGTGQSNTIAILSGCGQQGIAAKNCDDLIYDGFSDWFLPSLDELKLMWEHLGQKNIGSFSLDNYWSSTEGNNLDAYDHNFQFGGFGLSGKDGSNAIRAVRAF